MSDSPTPSGSALSPNQAEIDAALAAAGSPAVESNAASPSSGPADPGGLTHADVDAALAEGAVDSGAGVAVATATAVAAPQVESKTRHYDETAAAIAAALAEEQAEFARQSAASTASPPPGSMPMELPDFGRRSSPGEETRGVDLLNDVDLNVKIELGRAEMSIDEVLRLGAGAVVELNKLAGDPVDVLVNDRLVARGEVLILNDNFCVRISEILAGEGVEASV